MTPDRAVPSASTPDVILRQEQVRVGLDQIGVRAVVRRRVVTEVQLLEVTVRREVLEVEQEPVDGTGTTGADAFPRPLVVVLSEEVPVVHLETRPYEQVTLEVHTVTEQREIATEVSGERVEITSPQAPVH